MASSPQRPLAGPAAVEFVEHVVRRLISEGDYHPGARISDLQLSKRLGLGRTSVREAFQRLSKEGLISVIPNRGAFVTKLTDVQIDELYEVREALEVFAAKLAAERAPADRLASLQEMLAVTRLSLVKHGGHYPADLDFHERVLALAGNMELMRRASEVNMQLRVARLRSGYVPSRAEDAYEEHQKILDAIVERNVGRAESAMREHLVMARWSFRSNVSGPSDVVTPLQIADSPMSPAMTSDAAGMNDERS